MLQPQMRSFHATHLWYAIRTYGTFDGYIGHDGLDIIVKNNLEKS